MLPSDGFRCVALGGGFLIAGARVDLRGLDLDGLNLSSANLTYADFSGSQLVGTDLHAALLDGAVFNGANLTGANFTDASLPYVQWTNAICPDGTQANADPNGCWGHF